MKAGENETERVDLETNRVFVGEDVLGGTLPRSTYERLLTSKFTVAGCVKIMKVISMCTKINMCTILSWIRYTFPSGPH